MRVQIEPEADHDEDTEEDDFHDGVFNDHRNLRNRICRKEKRA